LPGYEWGQSNAMFAPAKTPPPVINKLNQVVARFLKTAEAKERLLNAGVEAVGSSPGELTAMIKTEMARVGKVIRDVGIQGR
jgi:tripartite-type tricarboxylate transporter receptor subunit TctC